MRERIKQLAEQAKNSVPQGTLGVTDWIDTYNQKFGELMVQECASLVSGFTYMEEVGEDKYDEIDAHDMLMSTLEPQHDA